MEKEPCIYTTTLFNLVYNNIWNNFTITTKYTGFNRASIFTCPIKFIFCVWTTQRRRVTPWKLCKQISFRNAVINWWHLHMLSIVRLWLTTEVRQFASLLFIIHYTYLPLTYITQSDNILESLPIEVASCFQLLVHFKCILVITWTICKKWQLRYWGALLLLYILYKVIVVRLLRASQLYIWLVPQLPVIIWWRSTALVSCRASKS